MIFERQFMCLSFSLHALLIRHIETSKEYDSTMSAHSRTGGRREKESAQRRHERSGRLLRVPIGDVHVKVEQEQAEGLVPGWCWGWVEFVRGAEFGPGFGFRVRIIVLVGFKFGLGVGFGVALASGMSGESSETIASSTSLHRKEMWLGSGAGLLSLAKTKAPRFGGLLGEA